MKRASSPATKLSLTDLGKLREQLKHETEAREAERQRAEAAARKAEEEANVFRANVGEVWAGPTTPLTSTSMSGWPFERAWRDLYPGMIDYVPGSEVRQVVAGIAEAYAPELLIGRKVVIVANQIGRAHV